jgi:hypothetical protein
MGLDATVYCNCFETGRLKEIPPFFETIFVDNDGNLDCRSKDFETQLEFDQWLFYRACEHENGVLLHHRMGNIALVSLLRNELSRESEKFPVILQKILYNGIHAGDYLALDEVVKLKTELDELGGAAASDARNKQFIDDFHEQLVELTNASLQVKKPISF